MLLCLTSVLSQDSMQNYCPPLIFCFYFSFIVFFLCVCALPYAIFPETNITKHHFSRRSPRPRIYRGDVRRYKTSPPSFSMRRKLIGLCWLLWRYCLWWLPLAVLSFGPLPWFTMLNCMAGYCGDHELCLVRCEFSSLLFCPGFLILANIDQ